MERPRRKLQRAARVPSRAATRQDRAATRCSGSSKGAGSSVKWSRRRWFPRKPGERIKTDRRDARKLAELHGAGLLTVVQAPTPAEEAVRDLLRARDDARADRHGARHRLGNHLDARLGELYAQLAVVASPPSPPGRPAGPAARPWTNRQLDSFDPAWVETWAYSARRDRNPK